MPSSINKKGDCFTGARYNILRVVAAYPLNANFHSRSKSVKAALGEDLQPLGEHETCSISQFSCSTSPDSLDVGIVD
jgi:hypothetical protein